MNTMELETLLHRVASSDVASYSDAYLMLTRRKISFDAFREVSLTFLLLLEKALHQDRLAFFRLHRVVVLSGITFPVMLSVLDGAENWEPSEILYGILLNQTTDVTGYHFVELVTRLVNHKDPAVAWAAANYLRPLALQCTGGRSTVWERRFLAEMFAEYLAPGSVYDQLREARES